MPSRDEWLDALLVFLVLALAGAGFAMGLIVTIGRLM
jgi:hypothetical protein